MSEPQPIPPTVTCTNSKYVTNLCIVTPQTSRSRLTPDFTNLRMFPRSARSSRSDPQDHLPFQRSTSPTYPDSEAVPQH